jgi:hypothetical protein
VPSPTAIAAHAESPHSLPSPPLSRGGEGRGEGGFEADTLTNFGSAIGINALRTRVNSLQTRVNALRTRDNALRTRVHLYQSQGQSLQLPPSLRFPPLREGNRVGRVGSVPPACRGNLKEGVIGHTRFCELWLRDWY